MTLPSGKRLRVCVATTRPGYNHARWLDWVLAQALDVRGAEIGFLVCDNPLRRLVEYVTEEDATAALRYFARGDFGALQLGEPGRGRFSSS